MRFAPSPNGHLHLGHAYSALRNRQWAAKAGGAVLLRMENIDLERCGPAFETAIVEDLTWLGFSWEPPPIRQSERFGCYAAALERLDRQGVLYPCYCTRGDIARAVADRPDWPRDPDGSPLYPGTCRRLSATERSVERSCGRLAALRLDMTAALQRHPRQLAWDEFGEGDSPERVDADPSAWGDAVLSRRDLPASYHVAVVCDDEAQGVTDVIRGDDLRQATSLHRLLQALLGYREPAYHHHRLIADPEGRKLSKSRNAPSLRALRHTGAKPEDIRARLGLADT